MRYDEIEKSFAGLKGQQGVSDSKDERSHNFPFGCVITFFLAFVLDVIYQIPLS